MIEEIRDPLRGADQTRGLRLAYAAVMQALSNSDEPLLDSAYRGIQLGMVLGIVYPEYSKEMLKEQAYQDLEHKVDEAIEKSAAVFRAIAESAQHDKELGLS